MVDNALKVGAIQKIITFQVKSEDKIHIKVVVLEDIYSFTTGDLFHLKSF